MLRKELLKIATMRLDKNPEEIQDSDDLQKDLGADSLDLAEMFMEAEKRFDVTISDEEAEKIKTFGDFLHCVEKKLN